jgi:type IV pilus assembly protein PilA
VLSKIRKMLKHQEGFTLVELMIVVVILGILAGVGIQQYSNVQERARKAAHEANQKVLTSAANMYLMLDDGDVQFVGDKATLGENDLKGYIDEWPTNPYPDTHDNGGKYVVTVTRTPIPGTTDEYSYVVSVTTGENSGGENSGGENSGG